MDEKILNIFRSNKDKYISGEEISRKLSISRAAVWKHIEKLRTRGYDFTAVPHLGYRLSGAPDRLFPEEIKFNLQTKTIVKKIIYFDSLPSTNLKCYELAEKGYPEGTIVVAETQTKGKGRLARQWISPKHKGIYFSILLRPDILPTQVSIITLMSAVSVVKALRRHSNVPALIKWPNDVLINDKKVCGILTEMNAELDRVNFIVLGIGINVNTRASELPQNATSVFLEKHKEHIDRVDLLKLLLAYIEKYYLLFKNGNFDPIIKNWRDFSLTLGNRIKIITHGNIVEGSALGIDNDGALIVRLDNGFQQKITAGDIKFLR